MGLFYIIPPLWKLILLKVSTEGLNLTSRNIFGVLCVPPASQIVPECPYIMTEHLLLYPPHIPTSAVLTL